jgi:histone deacetylase complex regulatory component SIN3
VIDKVKTLFHGFPELVLGFNTFLPKVRRRARWQMGWPVLCH